MFGEAESEAEYNGGMVEAPSIEFITPEPNVETAIIRIGQPKDVSIGRIALPLEIMFTIYITPQRKKSIRIFLREVFARPIKGNNVIGLRLKDNEDCDLLQYVKSDGTLHLVSNNITVSLNLWLTNRIFERLGELAK
jgi:hypothetical protein